MSLQNLITKIKGDIRAYAQYSADFQARQVGLLRSLSILLTSSLLCCLGHRISHLLWRKRFYVLARFVAWANFVAHKAMISPQSEIDGGLYIPHTVGVHFNGRAGSNLVLYAHAAVGPYLVHDALCGNVERSPTLGSDVIVGAFGVIYGKVTVGANTKIGPSAVINDDVPSGSLVLQRLRSGNGQG